MSNSSVGWRSPLRLVLRAALLLSLVVSVGILGSPNAQAYTTISGISYSTSYSTRTAKVVSYDGSAGTSVQIPRVITVGSTTYLVTTIGSSAFAEKGLTNVTISTSVTAIEYRAFDSNVLTSVTIPDSVTEIGYAAFSDNRLAALKLGSGVKTISDRAFFDNQLTSLTIPGSVEVVWGSAFAFNRLTSLTLNSGLKRLAGSAFRSNNLRSLTIPSSVVQIDNSVFSQNSLLATVRFLGNAPKIVADGDTSQGSFDGSNDKMLYFTRGATGFSTPTWMGYATAYYGEPAFSAAPTPTITGGTSVGYALTAHTGTWSPVPTFSYQWYRSGVAILGAERTTYTLSASDVDQTITVKVTGSRPGGVSTTRTSVATSAIKKGTLTAYTPTITGTPKVGNTLTATMKTWGPVYVVHRYQWFRNGILVSGPTGDNTYTLTASDKGAVITVVVTGIQLGYVTATRTSAATSTVVAGTFSSSTTKISGTVKVGYTLKASPTWSPTPSKFTYQWYRNGVAMTGATSSTYKLYSRDAGQVIKVRVKGYRSGYTTLAKYSSSTSKVAVNVDVMAYKFTSCKAMNSVYKHGDGKPTAVDKTSGTRVTTFLKSTALYDKIVAYGKSQDRNMDRDKDGIACER